jgi:hypothetical protein
VLVVVVDHLLIAILLCSYPQQLHRRLHNKIIEEEEAKP